MKLTVVIVGIAAFTVGTVLLFGDSDWGLPIALAGIIFTPTAIREYYRERRRNRYRNSSN